YKAAIALRQARAQNNTLAMFIVSSSFSARISDILGLTSVSCNIKRTKQTNTSLDTYFVIRQLSPTKQNEFHYRLLCIIVKNSLSFWFTETRTFHEFVAFFNTTVKISSRQMLSKRILKEYAKKLETSQVSALLKTQEPVTIMFDRWKNVCVSGTSQKTDNILNTICAFLEYAKTQTLNVVVMVTNSALSYALSMFNNTLEAISEEHNNVQDKVANNVVGLALLQYWEFAALNLKEIGIVVQRLFSIKVNSASCERLFSCMGSFIVLNDVILRNQIISLANYNIQVSSHEQSKSGTINLSDIVNISMLANNKNNSENMTKEINNEKNDNSAHNSDNNTDKDLTDEVENVEATQYKNVEAIQ
ncbi:4757_t:CDS:2, partial [Dentiscutata erythropus]